MTVRGFTLIELLVRLALIALVATAALTVAELAVQRGREAELRSALRSIRGALDAYKQAVDEGRVQQRAGDSGYPRTLELLVDGVEDARSPVRAPIRFLRKIPRDPMADPTVKPADSWGKRSYKSSSESPRPGEDVYDVFSRSGDVGINGVPYREW